MGRTIRLGLVLALLAGCVPEGRDLSDVGDEDEFLSVDALAAKVEGDYATLFADGLEEGPLRVVALMTLGAPGEAPALEARARLDGIAIGAFAPLEIAWSEQDQHVVRLDFADADGVELRVPRASLELLRSIRWNAVTPPVITAEEEGVDTTSSGLRADLGDLSIVTRAQWGAASARCSMTSDPNKYRMAIHHTEGASSDPTRQLRGVQAFHANKGWCDIGYHFLIDVDGTIYEGRELTYRGVHAANNNTGNIGISHIGNFHQQTPPAVMLASTARLVERLSSLYGIDLARSDIKGHREYSSTDCPGNLLYPRIGSIISDAQTIRSAGGTAPTPPPSSGGSCTHSFGGVYADQACSADYQCCGGAWRTQANGCGACVCTETSGQTGCSAPTPPPAPPPPAPPSTGGQSCTHSFGGVYAHLGCSADYQCCDGAWRTQAGGCGPCACTETSGQSGCQAQAPAPPSGQSCTHSFGGVYAHLACSTEYQCCDGAWRTRANGCGGCACEEGTGTQGCGAGGSAPPMTAFPHAGLTSSGSEIPRAGLSNSTLRATLGISTEPLGTVVTHAGRSWVRGRVSSFGGPNDTGVTSTETGAVSGERLRSLNNPLNPSASTLASRPEDYYYAAMRWAYSPNSVTFWRRQRFVVTNPTTGATIVVRAVDWGPHTRTGRVLDLSPQALRDLGATTDDLMLIAFAPEGTTLGVLR